MFEELCVHRIVATVRFPILGRRDIEYLHKKFAMIPEEIEHGEKFLYPDESFFVFLRMISVDAHLMEILEEPCRTSDASAVESFSLFFLIRLVAYDFSGANFYGFSDSSVRIPCDFLPRVFHGEF